MDIELLNELSFCFTDIIDFVTIVAPRQVNRMDAKDLMSCAFGRAAHIVQSIVDLPAWFSAACLAEFLKIVRIYSLAMQETKYFFVSLLSAAHVAFLEILAANAFEVELT